MFGCLFKVLSQALLMQGGVLSQACWECQIEHLHGARLGLALTWCLFTSPFAHWSSPVVCSPEVPFPMEELPRVAGNKAPRAKLPSMAGGEKEEG